jgi:hypothetical protein
MKKTLPLLAFTIIFGWLPCHSQTKNWNWSLEYSFSNSNPTFKSNTPELEEQLNKNCSPDFGNAFLILGGYQLNEKFSSHIGIAYRSMSYKNDSISLERVNLIENTTRGIEIPLNFDYHISSTGWLIGIGASYFIGIKDQISYQLLNNNQRQSSVEKSNLKGLGYQLNVSKEFKPDNNHVLFIGLVGQNYNNLVTSESSQFGYLNLGFRLGIKFL